MTRTRSTALVAICAAFIHLALGYPIALAFAPPSRGIERRRVTPLSQAVESPTNFLSGIIKKFNVGNVISIGNGDSARDDLANKLITRCKELGQVGSKLSEDEQSSIDDFANMLSAFSDGSPAKFDLEGDHNLIYSASPGGSSGAIGPFVGRVTQSFLDEEKFINRVELLNGAFKIELNAERTVLDDTRIRVMFKETVVSVFGKELIRKDVKGQGVWKCEFAGTVNLEINGKSEAVFLRVLKTPSTFVIAQKL